MKQLSLLFDDVVRLPLSKKYLYVHVNLSSDRKRKAYKHF